MTQKIVNQSYDPYALGLKVHSTSGGEFIVGCPYHDDGHPSACFNPVTGLFFCFSCGASATVNQLARHVGGRVVKIEGGRITRKLPSQDWRSILSSPLAMDHAYLKSRGVSNKQVIKWGIRALPGAIGVPVQDNKGKEVGIIIRKEKGTPRYLFFGAKPPLFPLGWLMDQLPGSDLYVVEGIFGKFRSERAGINSVSVMGATLQDSAGQYLRNFNVFGMFDNDFAGYCGGGRLLSIVPNARIIIPGMEADELSKDEWKEVAEGVLTTRSIAKLAKMSGDPDKFYRQLPKTRAQWLREKGYKQ